LTISLFALSASSARVFTSFNSSFCGFVANPPDLQHLADAQFDIEF